MFRSVLPARLAPLALLAVVAVGGLATTACSTLPPARSRSSALDFLYPGGTAPAAPSRQVALRLPARVGLAFPPAPRHAEPLTEAQKSELLERVAAAFRSREEIGHIEVIPSAYLEPQGGFANLDRVAAALGLDLVALLSYDQAQFNDPTRLSWTYLTVVGPLVIDGEKDETRTLLDAVVYHLPSRTLLLRAAGTSRIEGRSSPFNAQRRRRLAAAHGFEAATDQLIAELEAALTRFEEHAASGTVRGPGTPRIAFQDEAGQPVSAGGGAVGLGGAVMALLLAGVGVVARRRAAGQVDAPA